MPREGEHSENVKTTTHNKVTRACKLSMRLNGLPCYRWVAIDRAMDLLIDDLEQQLNKRPPNKE